METKGIIISKKEYERLTELEKNFDDKIKEHRETLKKGLEDAIKGNLIKVLWVKDEGFAEMMGCDLSDEGVCKFISKEDADRLASINPKVSYDRNDVLKRENAERANSKRIKDHKAAFGLYQEVIADQKKTIRYQSWALGIVFTALLVQLIAYIMK